MKYVFSEEAIHGDFVSGVTAGLFNELLKTSTDPHIGKVTVDLSSLQGIGRFADNQLLQKVLRLCCTAL